MMDPTFPIVICWMILGVVFIYLYELDDLSDQLLAIILGPILLLVFSILNAVQVIKKNNSTNRGDDDHDLNY